MKITFDQNFIDQYWHQQDPEFSLFLKEFENQETFIQDNNNKIQQKIQNLENHIEHWGSKDWAENSHLIISLYSYLPFSQFCYMFKFIDSHFPGMSIHYTMEIRLKNDITPEFYLISLLRLQILQNHNFLYHLYSPMRLRIIDELLSNQVEENLNE